MTLHANLATHHVLGYFAGFPDIFLAIVLLFVSLALIFAGKKLAKALAFIVTGAALAAIGATVGGLVLGVIGAILGAVVGFLVGGFIGIMLLELGIGVALGYIGYTASHAYLGGELLPIIIGVVMFVLGIVLADRILTAATVVLGGVLLFDVMVSLESGVALGVIVAVLVSALGLWVQNASETRTKQAPVTRPSTQPP